MPAQLRIHLFGGFRLTLDEDELSPIATLKARSLFAYLAMHAGVTHTRDLLAGIFWPDLPDAKARRRLSQALWRIQQPLPAAANPLQVRKDAVGFRMDAGAWVDVIAFETAMARGDETGWQEALTLYRGEFMRGFYDDWIILERERLRERYLDAVEALLNAHKAVGRLEEALRLARRMARAEPLRERTHQEIMRLNLALGRPQEALRQYDLLRDILDEELGISPSPATEALRQRLEAAITGAPSAQEVDGSDLPLIGREREYRMLLTLLESAMLGQGGVVLVEGEPGVGKTRLLEELAADAQWQDAQVLWAWGDDAGSAAYHLLQMILEAGITPMRAHQLRALAPLQWLSAAAISFPFLRAYWPDLPSLPRLPPKQERQRLHEALARILLALADIHPLVLIFEDVHWADASSLAALHHLMPALRHAQLLVACSFRGSEARDRPEVWMLLQRLRASGARRLPLAPLKKSATSELVRVSLGMHRQAPRFAQRIYRETQGNPLFVLEILRSLRDEGVLFRNPQGDWSTRWDSVTLDYMELPLPPGVRQVISRRLERLSSAERAFLQAAAILGDHFDIALVDSLIDVKVKESIPLLHSLVARRLLEEESTACRFSHNLVRRVVLCNMSEEARVRLHHRAVKALEVMRPDAVETLAHHAWQGELWQEAARYNRQAGDRARAMYAGDRAAAFYSRALTACQRLGEEARGMALAILQRRGELYQETGRFDLAQADFQRVIQLTQTQRDLDARAQASNALSYLHFQRGEYAQALELAMHTLGMAQATGSDALIAKALLNAANALRNMGRSQESVVYYRRAASLLESLGDHISLADSLNRMGFAYVFNGQLTEAEIVMQRALSMRRRLDDRVGLAYSLINLSTLCLLQGRLTKSLEAAQEALQIATYAGDPYGQDAALFCEAGGRLNAGDVALALERLQQALKLAQAIDDRPLVAEALADIGRCHLLLGDEQAAREALERSRACFEEGGEVWYQWKMHEGWAWLLMRRGQPEAALAEVREALTIAQTIRSPHLLGEAHRMMGWALAQRGEAPDVVEMHFRESLRWLEGRGFQPALARTLAAYGGYLTHIGEKARGEALTSRAQALSEVMGMKLAWNWLTPVKKPIKTMDVRLPRCEAPTGRPVREDEWVTVHWRIQLPEDALIRHKGDRRRHRLLRLLREAREQGAAPRVTDLARALEVAPRTIKRDLARLRATGHEVCTRGART